MTTWLPTDVSGSGPFYVRLADRIEQDIVRGALKPGDKLPPQRNLAFDIGVTIGTVGRAYALARSRGLISGEVGRGTYILEQREDADASDLVARPFVFAGTRAPYVSGNATRFDSSAAPYVEQTQAIAQITQAILTDHPHEIANYTRTLPTHWLEAGSAWLSVGKWQPHPDNVVPTLGGHAALVAAALTVTNPGDRIILEELSYSSFGRSLNLAGRRTVTVAIDDQGVIPEDLERVCAQLHPKLLFIMPGMQNPTLGSLTAERRHAIADIARRHNLWLIEDVIYGALADDGNISLAELAPERTFRVDGLSKSVAAGVRSGWMCCPPGLKARVHAAHKLMTGGLAFLLAELSARLVLSGEAQTIRAAVRAEISARHNIVCAGLDGFDFVSHPLCPYVWLAVPEPWQSSTLKKAAENEGVLIDDEDEFKSGRGERAYHRVRIGFTVPTSRQGVQTGIATLRSLMDGGNAVYHSYS